MISRFFRPLCLFGAALLGVVVGPVLHAQVTTVAWTGAVNSDYLNAGNWAGGVVPGATSDIQFLSTPTNRVVNLTYAGQKDIYGIQNALAYGYTLNLSGTTNAAADQLVYNIVGRGTHPYLTDATGTSTGSSTNRLSFYVNMSNAKISFVGSSTLAMLNSVAGMTYMKINMTNGSVIDCTGMTSASGRTTVGIGGLNMAAGTSVNLGAYVGYINGSNLAGEEQRWAGSIFSTNTGATIDYSAAGAKTRVMPTGVVTLPGGYTLRYGSQYLVDGVHNGPISTFSGQTGSIGGSGIINGLVSISLRGSLAPGGQSAAGNLTVNGNINLNSAASFELWSPTQFDHLQVNGTLILQPTAVPPAVPAANTSQLVVGVSDTFPLIPSTYRIANITGGISGSFSGIFLPQFSGLAANAVIGADYIDIVFSQIRFSENPNLHLTGNNIAVADTFYEAILSSKAPPVLIEQMNRQTNDLLFKEVLEGLSPTCYYSWYPAAVTRTSSMITTIEDRLSQKGQRVKGAMDAYVMTYRQESSIDAGDLADYSNYDTISTLGGVDMLVAPGFTMGGMFEYANTRTDLNQLSSTSETDSMTVGLYAQAQRGAFEVQVAGFGGFDKYDAKRNVQRTLLATWATSDTKGQRLGGSLSTSYTKKFKWVEVSPSIGGYILSWNVNEFQEEGAAQANLLIKEQKRTAYVARAGLRLSQTYSTKRGTIRPFVNVVCLREFGGNNRKINAELFGTALITKVPSIQKSGVRFDFGVDWSLAEKLSAQVRYVTEAGGASDESVGVRGGLNFAF